MPTPFEAPELWIFFWGLGVATSALSAVVGLAGGVLLLGGLLLVLDPIAAIPVHGVAQLTSNASRAFFQRAHIRWNAVRPFLLLLVPGGLLGVLALEHIPPDLGRLAIGVFALLAIWLPRWFRVQEAHEGQPIRGRFVVAGGLAGVANMIFGATGPLCAPFVLSMGVDRLATVATLAMCQGAGHMMKVAVFTVRGFRFEEYALGLGILCLSTVIGTAIGSRLLHRVSELWFRRGIRIAVTAVAIRLVWQGTAMRFAAP